MKNEAVRVRNASRATRRESASHHLKTNYFVDDLFQQLWELFSLKFRVLNAFRDFRFLRNFSGRVLGDFEVFGAKHVEMVSQWNILEWRSKY